MYKFLHQFIGSRLNHLTNKVGKSGGNTIDRKKCDANVDPGELKRIADAHLSKGEYALAEEIYLKASANLTADKNLWLNLSFALYHNNKIDASITFANKALRLDDKSTDAHYILGLAEQSLGHKDASIRHFEAAIELDGHFEPAYGELCVALAQAGKHPECRAVMRKAIDIFPQNVMFQFYAGNACFEAGDMHGAIEAYKSALALRLEFPEALQGLFTAYQTLGRFDEAVRVFQRFADASPENAWTHYHLGRGLSRSGQHLRALASFEKALALQPTLLEAHFSYGVALEAVGRLQDALERYSTALTIDPKHVKSLNSRGILLQRIGNHAEALQSFSAALELDPDDRNIISNCGQLCALNGQYEEAMKLFLRLISLDPRNDFAKGTYLSLKLTCCEWKDYDYYVAIVRGAVGYRRNAIAPLPFFAISNSTREQLLCAEAYFSGIPKATKQFSRKLDRAKGGRIHVAYLSADFHDHATAYLMAELFELHDRAKYVLTAVSFGPDSTGPMRARLKKAFDHFIDVRLKSDEEAAQILAEMKVDIAVDLKGYTADSRPGIFVFHAAPIQVNYLGYPGTLGTPHIDYIIADRVVIPFSERENYSEGIVYMPNSYQVNDRHRAISPNTPTRKECGLPSSGFVFCCFNNNYKINPRVFSVWMRILKTVPGSVLWLLADNPIAARNLKSEAMRRGVDSDRLIFAPRVDLDLHLARHRLADLFLDTLPCNAHTTASDALWAGLPVLTCMGPTFASRVAASLLHALGLPELVSESIEEYEQIALDLANDPDRLDQLRKRIETNKPSSALFDTSRYCAQLESAYETMYAICANGDSPACFSVRPL